MKKKVFLSLLLASLVMVSFSSCKDKDEPNNSNKRIEGIIDKSGIFSKNLAPRVNLDEYFVEVKLTTIINDAYEIMTKSDIKDNKFSLELKKPTIPLVKISDILKGENITISNKDAKIVAVENLKVKKKDNDKFLGNLQYIKSNLKDILEKQDDEKIDIAKISSIAFLYVDRDVKITGTTIYEQAENIETIFNLNLKKGWNIIKTTRIKNYNTGVEKEESTVLSKMPTDYTWYLVR